MSQEDNYYESQSKARAYLEDFIKASDVLGYNPKEEVFRLAIDTLHDEGYNVDEENEALGLEPY